MAHKRNGNGANLGEPDSLANIGRRMRLAADMGDAGDIPDAQPMKTAPDMADAADMAFAAPALTGQTIPRITIKGSDILELARKHIGEKYVFGARVPLAHAGWTGPWDCAEFVSWCHFHGAGILFGTQPDDNPLRADAYTGYWGQQANRQGCTIPVADAMAIPGAVLLRLPQPAASGHIVLSDGAGGTVEAHSSAKGVIAGSTAGRRWDVGILVPGIDYFRSDQAVQAPDSPFVLRLSEPMMKGTKVLQVQRALNKLGLPAGAEDGIYGPQTAHAVEIFQARNGLVADGEYGPATEKKLLVAGKA